MTLYSEEHVALTSRLSSEEEMKPMPLENSLYRSYSACNRKKWIILILSIVSFTACMTFASLYGFDYDTASHRGDGFADLRPLSTYEDKEPSCGKRDEVANMTIWNAAVDETSHLLDDMFTIVVQTYRRPVQLNNTLLHLTQNKVPSLLEIIVVWNDLETEPPADFTGKYGVPVHFRLSEANSLNQKFLPDPAFQTQGILLQDDDWNYNTTGDLEYAFQQWRRAGMHRLTGAFARCWHPSPKTGNPLYSLCRSTSDTYSMVLTGLAFSHISFLNYYHSEDPLMSRIRQLVDQEFNCEDIAFNFMVSMLTCEGPLQVIGRNKLDHQAARTGISTQPGFPTLDPVESYWQCPPHRIAHHRTTLELPNNVEYLIIGSGITGATIAYKLLERNPSASVLMIEARTAASAASGRNGGHCRAGWWHRFPRNMEQYGEDEAIKIDNLEQANVRAVAQFVRLHNIDCDFRPVETAEVFKTQSRLSKAMEVVRVRQEMHQRRPEAGLAVNHRILQGEEAQAAFGIPEIVGATSYLAYTLNPYLLVCSSLEFSLLKGLNLQTNTLATKITREDNQWRVNTQRGSVQAKHVILATNAYTNALYPHLGATSFLVPSRRQVAAFRPGSKAHKLPALTKSCSLSDYNGGDYYLVRQTGLHGAGDMLYGGGEHISSERGCTDDSNLNQEITEYLHHAAADYFGRDVWGADGRVVRDWAGITCYTSDSYPIVGQAEPGLWISVGMNGHGIYAASLIQLSAHTIHFADNTDLAGAIGTWVAVALAFVALIGIATPWILLRESRSERFQAINAADSQSKRYIRDGFRLRNGRKYFQTVKVPILLEPPKPDLPVELDESLSINSLSSGTGWVNLAATLEAYAPKIPKGDKLVILQGESWLPVHRFWILDLGLLGRYGKRRDRGISIRQSNATRLMIESQGLHSDHQNMYYGLTGKLFWAPVQPELAPLAAFTMDKVYFRLHSIECRTALFPDLMPKSLLFWLAMGCLPVDTEDPTTSRHRVFDLAQFRPSLRARRRKRESDDMPQLFRYKHRKGLKGGVDHWAESMGVDLSRFWCAEKVETPENVDDVLADARSEKGNWFIPPETKKGASILEDGYSLSGTRLIHNVNQSQGTPLRRAKRLA
ncbi:FAD dependent oxidoreductase [Fusarium austroafricanum]|uniref:FAD dependent oxidoreductase n=1 Tax=Fusarium austroafricanum TaxID=2364996 RepID=A0A8H4KSG7_9HYPO|nr:FAD dependent oxidoreductase [Fusarium austroafricanum]